MRRPHVSPPPFHPARPGLVAPVRVDPQGLTGPTPRQARGPFWRQVGPGAYVPSGAPSTGPGQRVVEAAALLPAYGGVTGWAALHWVGGRWFDGVGTDGVTPLPVTLAVGGHHLRGRGGAVASNERLSPPDLVVVDGVQLLITVRSVAFEMRYAATLADAVRVLDMAAFSDLVSVAEVACYLGTLNGWTGIPQARAALALAEENAWSPPEVAMRLAWTREGGFPRPRCNVPVFDLAGRHLGTPDLIDPGSGVIGEYDGRLHLAGRQRSRDVRRDEVFRAAGLEQVTVLGADLADRGPFLDRLASAYARAAVRSRPVGWTCEQPAWWTPTETVEQRRALTARDRARFLAIRAG